MSFELHLKFFQNRTYCSFFYSLKFEAHPWAIKGLIMLNNDIEGNTTLM